MGNLKYTNLPSDTLQGDALVELALDMSWSWRHETGELWRQLNQELWDATRNPWVVLQTVSGEKLEKITSAQDFRGKLQDLTKARRAEMEAPRWFQQAHANSPLHTVAYFSMEYMLSEALPIYSGGLGNVAGDQLKAANDLGVPVIAVGLLYDQGYFRQEIDREGNQRALYPYNDPGQLPIRPVRDEDGDWVRLELDFPGVKLWLRTWEVQVGRAKLYLLDANDPANLPEYRSITSELYGGGPDLRLRQEHVLGIGGWRLLRTLGIKPEVAHLNEGHAAFAILERAANYMEDTGHPFETAMAVTRAGNLFTTHTPVEAGFDRFGIDLMRTHFAQYCGERLKISFDELMALGRRNAGDANEDFNMAYFALRGCGAVNGVSRLHGAVSRSLFQPLFPRWPTNEVPVRSVTNGVHVPTWDSTEAHHLWAQACGGDCWHGELERVEKGIRSTTDAAIWQMRVDARKTLVDRLRRRNARQVAIQGGWEEEIKKAGEIFDPNVLTIGFARRFATYKRPNLLLHDPQRLLRILGNPQHPVQLVLAGKAHPADRPGQEMIRAWLQFIGGLGERPPVIFLSDYDMRMAERLVGGVDVWINTPRRPWEASGTSGMKVLVNGGVNLSELDGWWAEAYTPEVGWALGDGREHGEDPAWDAAEADALYTLLEREIVPQFYERNEAGIPTKWVARIRESMARLTPAYSANRTVREYTENHYLPGAAGFAARADQGGKLGVEIAAWQSEVSAKWSALSFGPLKVESPANSNDRHRRFEVVVYLGSLDPGAVRVELYADARDGIGPFKATMERGARLPDGGLLYSLCSEDRRDFHDFTARAVPYHPAAVVPLEANQILWQR